MKICMYLLKSCNNNTTDSIIHTTCYTFLLLHILLCEASFD